MVYQRYNYKDAKTFKFMVLRHIKYLEDIMTVRPASVWRCLAALGRQQPAQLTFFPAPPPCHLQSTDPELRRRITDDAIKQANEQIEKNKAWLEVGLGHRGVPPLSRPCHAPLRTRRPVWLTRRTASMPSP